VEEEKKKDALSRWPGAQLGAQFSRPFFPCRSGIMGTRVDHKTIAYGTPRRPALGFSFFFLLLIQQFCF
jgi:hypothetical protein